MSLSSQFNRILTLLRTHRTAIASSAVCLLLGLLVGGLSGGGAETITETLVEREVDTLEVVRTDTVTIVDTVALNAAHTATMVELEKVFDEYPELSRRDKRRWRKAWAKADKRVKRAEEKAYKRGYKDGAKRECAKLKGENKQLKKRIRDCKKNDRRQDRLDAKTDRREAKHNNKRSIPGWVWPVGILLVIGGVALYLIKR